MPPRDLGQTQGYLSDLAAAWKLSEENSAGQFPFASHATSIGLEIRYALLTASVNSIAANLSPDLLAELVTTGVWTPAQALAYARHTPASADRRSRLAALAPLLSADMLR